MQRGTSGEKVPGAKAPKSGDATSRNVKTHGPRGMVGMMAESVVGDKTIWTARRRSVRVSGELGESQKLAF